MKAKFVRRTLFLISIFAILIISQGCTDSLCPDELPKKDGKNLILFVPADWKYVGETDRNFSKDVPGLEKRAGFVKGDIQLVFEFIEGKKSPYQFWFFNKRTNKTYGNRVDADNDGTFEYAVPNCRLAWNKWEIPEFRESWGIKN